MFFVGATAELSFLSFWEKPSFEAAAVFVKPYLGEKPKRQGHSLRADNAIEDKP